MSAQAREEAAQHVTSCVRFDGPLPYRQIAQHLRELFCEALVFAMLTFQVFERIAHRGVITRLLFNPGKDDAFLDSVQIAHHRAEHLCNVTADLPVNRAGKAVGNSFEPVAEHQLLPVRVGKPNHRFAGIRSQTIQPFQFSSCRATMGHMVAFGLDLNQGEI